MTICPSFSLFHPSGNIREKTSDVCKTYRRVVVVVLHNVRVFASFFALDVDPLVQYCSRHLKAWPTVMKSTADFDASPLQCAVEAPGLGVRSAHAIIGSVPHGFSLQNLARPLNDAEVNIGWFDLRILGDSEPQR